ncbi:hypothetical protein R6Q59_010082 [Mikania micrantha]
MSAELSLITSKTRINPTKMDKAKEAVSKIIGRTGQHDTEVHETVNPAVTSETVKPHRHEQTTEAVDREVHQHHYHTTVQPLKHEETLPEKHTHQQMPVQEREYHHGDRDEIKRSIDAEAAQFADTSRTHQTTHSHAQAPAATGEHVHHHVHEQVQPVIHKTTHQPEVVHTTVPIHETHHAQAEHHGLSTLPTKTLDEFKSMGGAITGGSERHEKYEGHPRPYNPEMQATRSAADSEPALHDGLHKPHPIDGLTKNTGVGAGGVAGTSAHHGHHGHHGHHHQGAASGLTNTSGTHSGTTGGLSGTSASNVSGTGVAGLDQTSIAPGTTGTASGGRTEDSTVTRALDTTGHSSTGVGNPQTGTGIGSSYHTGTGADTTRNDASPGGTHIASGIGSTTGAGAESRIGRDLEHSSTGQDRSTGTTTHTERDHADKLSSTNTAETGTTRDVKNDVQSPSQGKDPSLVETKENVGNWKGEGVPGSHSAVFGLTPDGRQYDDTSHGTTALRPAHTKKGGNVATGKDTGSRAPGGSGVAEQLDSPGVLQKGHGGPDMTDSGSAKPGAGAPGGEQGLGQVRPSEHGAESKLKDKIDPTTDADGDGKRGVMD